MRKFAADLNFKLGLEPALEEVSEATWIGTELVQRLIKYEREQEAPRSLDEPVSLNDRDVDLEEVIPDPTQDVEREADFEEMHRKVAIALDRLMPQEKLVIEAMFALGEFNHGRDPMTWKKSLACTGLPATP